MHPLALPRRHTGQQCTATRFAAAAPCQAPQQLPRQPAPRFYELCRPARAASASLADATRTRPQVPHAPNRPDTLARSSVRPGARIARRTEPRCAASTHRFPDGRPRHLSLSYSTAEPSHSATPPLSRPSAQTLRPPLPSQRAVTACASPWMYDWLPWQKRRVRDVGPGASTVHTFSHSSRIADTSTVPYSAQIYGTIHFEHCNESYK